MKKSFLESIPQTPETQDLSQVEKDEVYLYTKELLILKEGRYGLDFSPEVIFQWLHMKIPGISLSTSVPVGIQTRKSH